MLSIMNLRLLRSPFRIQMVKKCLANDTRTTSPSGTSSPVNANVPGLSDAVLKVPNSEVGPGASKAGEYKNPEYFSYNHLSYFTAEIEMLKYRCPQPSSKAKK